MQIFLEFECMCANLIKTQKNKTTVEIKGNKSKDFQTKQKETYLFFLYIKGETKHSKIKTIETKEPKQNKFFYDNCFFSVEIKQNNKKQKKTH